jgi:hypothetical protein
MKKIVLFAGLLALALPLCAQTAKKPPASPTEKATGTIGGHSVTITYASPRVRGREGHIFGPGGLISHDPHYPVWRAGANAATTLETDGDLKIGDLTVPKGTYTLFADVSNPDQWTLIVSKDTGEWGLKYNGADDLGRTPMQMSKPPQMVEDLTWTISDDAITLSWEDHTASVSVSAQ